MANCSQVRIGRLESKILSPLGPCPPPLSDSHQPYADKQNLKVFVRCRVRHFIVWGGWPTRRFYEGRLYAASKKISWGCLLQKEHRKSVNDVVQSSSFRLRGLSGTEATMVNAG